MTPVAIANGELVVRLGLAAVLCGLIGLEREARGQVAGLRTHILVGLGSALFTLVSAYAFAGVSAFDPTRIAASIVTGVGFLGAGAIIRHGLNVRGLTTAAALWIVAAVGMSVGAGFYLAAVVTTALGLFSLVGFRRLRPALRARLRPDELQLEVELAPSGRLGDVLGVLDEAGMELRRLESGREDGGIVAILEVQAGHGVSVERCLGRLAELTGVVGVATSETWRPLGR